MQIFARLESEVRGYIRAFPTVFSSARGAYLTDESQKRYLDFFAGAGTLNYGHNHPALKEALVEYITADGVVHGLDMGTSAKQAFLETFEETILKPRGLDYKLQFTGPTGTNVVEAAIKLARKVTGRTGIVAFTHGFHGMTLGSLALTANNYFRKAAGVALSDVTHLPFDGYFGPEIDTLAMIRQLLDDPSSGLDLPAAVIVETVQGEGGVNVASAEWLQGLQQLCRERGILFIVDDIQAGCGRTGSYFSFERAGIVPDMVTLSKSLSGYGLPMALLLLKPELDQWEPAEHNGTFRGNNLAFVTATAALETFWRAPEFMRSVHDKTRMVCLYLDTMIAAAPAGTLSRRGVGLMQGLVFANPELAGRVTKLAFEKGLIIETSGAHDEVIKLLPPLTIEREALLVGLKILHSCVSEVLGVPLNHHIKDQA
ncbi:diaminobutyrate--2-oxoglutarate transaminase [Chitinibacteraceae bacterium HSL-7]